MPAFKLSPPRRRLLAAAAAAVVALALPAGWLSAMAAPSVRTAPHVHGQVRLDVVVESKQLTLEFEMPMESLVGFESSPRTEDERRQMAEAQERLRSPGIIRPAAQSECGLKDVRIEIVATDDGHADVIARYEFECARATELRAIDLGLFDAFSRIRRIEARFVGSRGSGKQALTRAQRTLKLAP